MCAEIVGSEDSAIGCSGTIWEFETIKVRIQDHLKSAW